MNNFFNISEMTSLAFHSMALIAATGNEMLNVKSIAQEIGASENHLSKVMQRLVKAGMLRSVRGPSGGFELSQPAEQITLLQIFQVIEGENTLDDCPSQRPVCPFAKCLFGGILERFNMEFADYLAGHTLADFSDFLKSKR